MKVGRFRIFGEQKPATAEPVSIPLDLSIEGETSTLSLEGPASPRLALVGDDLTFDLPHGETAYFVLPGNTRGFGKPQPEGFSLPPGRTLRASIIAPAPDGPSATLYLFLCDEEGRPLVKRGLRLDEAGEIVINRPREAAKAFVALRLVGQGRLPRFGLAVHTSADAAKAASPASPIDLSYREAVAMMAQREQDDMLLEYVERVSATFGTSVRTRYIGAAANEAGRAKRFAVEAACLERLHDISPSPAMRQKIARSYYRDAQYDRLAEVIRQWPDVLATNEASPFHAPAEEIRAAATLAERLQLPHAERYRAPTGGAPRMAYLLHNSLPYASGGYATRSHGLMRGILASGGAGAMLARPGFPTDSKEDSGAPDGRSTRRIDGVTYRFENSFGRRGRLYRYMLDAGDYFADAAARSVTALHAASNFYTGISGAYAAATLRTPFVYEIRGFWELTRESRDAAFAASPLYARNRRLEQACAHQADHVLTLTASMKQEIESWGVPPERITLAPNAVDPDVFQPVPRDEKLARRLGIGPDDLVIGYVGSFVDYEGLDMLVEAVLRLMAKDDRVRLMIVGDDTPGGAATVPVGAQLRAQVAGSGMADRVCFTGRIPHEDVPAHYSLIDICPFPRRPVPVCEMVSPMKPLEAMAMEKCVIVSSVGGMEGMVRDGETGLVFKKGDVGALGQALRKAMAPALRARLGRNAREWVKTERSWKSVGASVADLHAALARGDVGFRDRPDDYERAMARFAETFPILPVIDAAADGLLGTGARSLDYEVGGEVTFTDGVTKVWST